MIAAGDAAERRQQGGRCNQEAGLAAEMNRVAARQRASQAMSDKVLARWRIRVAGVFQWMHHTMRRYRQLCQCQEQYQRQGEEGVRGARVHGFYAG